MKVLFPIILRAEEELKTMIYILARTPDSFDYSCCREILIGTEEKDIKIKE